MIERLLIANRGEIACRIMRTAQRLGIHCIAVYSDADQLAMHVRMADEAWRLGPSTARESYLHQERLLEIARLSCADAIHPGYGFLSENAGFAEACHVQGLIFVGPPAKAMQAMGNKAEAKALLEHAQVPLVPGYHGMDQGEQLLLEQARQIGFPVLIKAAAGGGGKGMRAVEYEKEFLAALHAARREALAAFSDDRVLLEKLVSPARHVEVQILADQHGQVLSLHDRDCSIQRRHQKVLEEAPAPNLPVNVRQDMAQAAVRAAKAVGYINAGTIEFLVDADFNFYFMEMNTRLQVEHPVTEAISGLDLVEWQLRIATGESLPWTQDELKPKGHALEVRIYAEDPANDFLPGSGEIHTFDWQPAPWLRIDTGYQSGDSVSDFYDAMIAKVVVWGDDRSQALHRLGRALANIRLRGPAHNTGFLCRLVRDADVARAHIHTRFLEQHQDLCMPREMHHGLPTVVWSAIWLALSEREQSGRQTSPWSQLHDFRLAGFAQQRVLLEHQGQRHEVLLEMCQQNKILWVYAGQSGQVQATFRDQVLHLHGDQYGQWHGAQDDQRIYAFVDGDVHEFLSVVESATANQIHTGTSITAPMNGRIVDILCVPGQKVEAGDVLAIVEAMKMEHRVKAHRPATIDQVLAQAGDLVQSGQVLIELKVD